MFKKVVAFLLSLTLLLSVFLSGCGSQQPSQSNQAATTQVTQTEKPQETQK